MRHPYLLLINTAGSDIIKNTKPAEAKSVTTTIRKAILLPSILVNIPIHNPTPIWKKRNPVVDFGKVGCDYTSYTLRHCQIHYGAKSPLPTFNLLLNSKGDDYA